MRIRNQPVLSAKSGPEVEAETWAGLRRGLVAIAGHPRILVYDLATDDAPSRLTRSGIALRGSARWRSYLARRRELDDGQLTLVFAVRRLERAERLLAVDWGTAHANAFLLIEPRDATVDLSNPAAPAARVLASASTGDVGAVAAMLRGIYGSWVYWPAAPATEDGCERIELPLGDGPSNLFDALQEALRSVFPPRAFREQLTRLLQDESELFSGRSVEGARSPFLTRLGLPAVYEPSLVTGAVRQLVNEGRISAFSVGGHGYFQGPSVPVPDEVPNELFERMVL